MSLAALLSNKSVDKGLDDVFESSAGPSIIASSDPLEILKPAQKRKSEDANEGKRPKKSRLSEDGRRKNSEPKVNGKGEKEEKLDDYNRDASDKADSSDENDSSSEIPEHESVRKSLKKAKRGKKVKYVPEGETREQRDARTIFIGNLPVAVVKSKPLAKQLKRHILSLVPLAKIESIRYRSVAFSNPTTKLEEEGEEKPSKKQKRQQKRAAEWREHQDSPGSIPTWEKKESEEDDENSGKAYMTPAEKRRLAAIKGDVHEHTAATTNAYVVFAYPVPISPDAPKFRVSREVMDPFAATREAIEKVDGTMFADHVLRVDLVGKKVESAHDAGGIMTDPKRSIFVGNLDFASTEDDVRAFFEKLMCEERGQPGSETKRDNESIDEAEEEDVEEDNSRKDAAKPRWVTRIRIVRDRETQLGKGFAYVQFSDRDCVDEVLALEDEKLKFAKRTLRAQRCKPQAVLAAKSKLPQQSSVKARSEQVTKRAGISDAPLPKGDPSLGKRIAGLPKDARKQAKATDPSRIARRLAKKKARMALDKAGKESKRVRVRKDKKTKNTVNTGRKPGKRRERSERNAEKKNIKK